MAPADPTAVPPTPPPPAIHPVVADVTARVTDRSRASRTAYLQRISRAASELSLRPARTDLGLLQPRPRRRRVRRQRPHHDGRRHRREPRHHHVLQRHALGARAVRALPRSDEADRPRGRCGRPRGRWRARHVRRHHPGAGRHGAQPVQPRRHRDVGGDRAQPRRVRRRPHARRLRQDRARARGGRAVVRSPADRRWCPPGRWRRVARTPRRPRPARPIAAGEVGRDELLESEVASYHSPGTCTFYGTANSNQMLMDVMGLHLPGAAFVHPDDPLRDALTAATTARVAEIAASDTPYGIGQVVDEKAVVNGVVALLATGGSTNHTMHLISMAAAAGIDLTWEDFDDLSAAVPSVARIYPNGPADVNHFHAAGGTPFLVRTLLDNGLLPRGRPDARRSGAAPLHPAPGAGRRSARVRRRRNGIRRPCRAARGRRPVHRRRWPAGPRRHAGPRGHQGVRGRARAPRRRGAGPRLHRPGRLPPGVLAARARPRRRRRHPRAGPVGQRHARAARPHPFARGAAEARVCRGAGHRRPHEWGVGRHSGRDPRDARVGARRADLEDPGRRRRPGRLADRAARRAGRRGRVRGPGPVAAGQRGGRRHRA